MKRKMRWLVGGTLATLVIGTSAYFYVDSGTVTNPLKLEQNVFSQDLVVDGRHVKLHYPIHEQKNEWYIALPDLIDALDITMKKKGDKVTVTYDGEHLVYEAGTLTHAMKKETDVASYYIEKDVIYLPKNHLERFFGLRVSMYLSEATHTLAIQTPKEQQKEAKDQLIGDTIFVHKESVPRANYEPRNGLYVGGYVLQDEAISFSMKLFNSLADKQHASYFKYVGYGKPFPTEWVNDVKSVGGFPHIAWEPNNGLEEVVDDEYLRTFAKEAKQAGVPILLRYASEMNGTWTFYSGNEDLYIEKWRLVHDVMAEEAPNVLMLWNVFTMPESTIQTFYPGDDYVDYVGVNIYNVMYHNDKLTSPSDFEDPLRLLDYVYNTYSHKKPIVIGEFGATNYTITDGLYHTDFAVEKISRMYRYLPILYPRVKMIYYFDVNNLVNAPEGRKINNYAITENARIMHAYQSEIDNAWYQSTIDETTTTAETFTYRDFLFTYQQTRYVDKQFVEDYVGLQVEKGEKKNEYIISDPTKKTKPLTVKVVTHTIDKAAFFEKRTLEGLPILEILQHFSIHYEIDEHDMDNLHIYL